MNETIDKEFEFDSFSRQCNLCKHLVNPLPTKRICQAFPQGIPKKIWNNEIKHDKPIKGQNGNFVFEKRGKREKE